MSIKRASILLISFKSSSDSVTMTACPLPELVLLVVNLSPILDLRAFCTVSPEASNVEVFTGSLKTSMSIPAFKSTLNMSRTGLVLSGTMWLALCVLPMSGLALVLTSLTAPLEVVTYVLLGNVPKSSWSFIVLASLWLSCM